MEIGKHLPDQSRLEAHRPVKAGVGTHVGGCIAISHDHLRSGDCNRSTTGSTRRGVPRGGSPAWRSVYRPGLRASQLWLVSCSDQRRKRHHESRNTMHLIRQLARQAKHKIAMNLTKRGRD
jgi:hypothetical protein